MCIKHKLKVGWQREGESEKGREIETYRSSRERERTDRQTKGAKDCFVI